MEHVTDYQYTVVYDQGSIIESVLANLLHRVQVVPEHGVDEFLALDLLSSSKANDVNDDNNDNDVNDVNVSKIRFTYTPDVILFTEKHKDAFIKKGFPKVMVVKYDNFADTCTLIRNDFILSVYINAIVAYETQTDQDNITVKQANDFILMMSGGCKSSDKSAFIRMVAQNILSQIGASIGITGLERLHAIILSGSVIKEVSMQDIRISLAAAVQYQVNDLANDSAGNYRVMVISTRASAHNIVDIARQFYDLSTVIIINYVMAARTGATDPDDTAVPNVTPPIFHVTVINETCHPMSLGYKRDTPIDDLVREWVFGSSSTGISYAIMEKKNELVELLYKV